MNLSSATLSLEVPSLRVICVMNPPSMDVVNILIDAGAGLGLTFATNLFIAKTPSTPDAAVTVHDTGGFDPDTDWSYQRPTVQVAVRGARDGYLAAHRLAQTIRDILNGRHNIDIGGTHVVCIWCQGDVIPLGFDENHRPLFTVNFRMHRTLPA